MVELSIAVAFWLVSCHSCHRASYQLSPGFLAYLGGAGGDDPKTHRKDIFISSVFFVLGFSFIFAILGVLLNTLLKAFAYDVQLWLSRAGGIIIIFFGLYIMGLIKIKWLEKEHKVTVNKKFKSKNVTSFVFGAAFAVGWTPCVGAALGAILGLAATQPGAAFYLLLTYALGLGLPFLVVGAFTGEVTKFLGRFARAVKYINFVFGLLLIGLGILIFTQKLQLISNFEFLNQILLG